MADDEIIWPVGTTDRDPDLGSRPMVFNPKKFLIAILPDAHEAERASAALRDAGFPGRHLRIFTGEEILEDYARYIAQPSLPRRVIGAITDDRETLELYHGHARDGRAALWVYVTDDDAANRAIRCLADFPTLHIRNYGRRRQSDFYLQRPTQSPAPRSTA